MKQIFLLIFIISWAGITHSTDEATPLPEGSYQRSCQLCSMSESPSGTPVLSCHCTGDKGSNHKRFWPTKLYMGHCQNPSDIANLKGQLVCMKNPSSGIPEGTYLNSCNECRINDRNQLECVCHTEQGKWQPASLSLDICPGEYLLIQNCNGELTCANSCYETSE